MKGEQEEISPEAKWTTSRVKTASISTATVVVIVVTGGACLTQLNTLI